jgi:hypothetical protein
MKRHPTRSTIIKRAQVDVLMVPLVNWLNRFDEVHTLACCQGQEGKPTGLKIDGKELRECPLNDRAYILFTCTNPLQLATILEVIGRCAIVEISWDRQYPLFRYMARFNNRHALESVLSDIRRRSRQANPSG